MLVNHVGFKFEDTCSQIQTTQILLFLSSVGIGLGVSAQKMKSTKIRAQQKLIKLQYINGGWTNTESLITASWINEYAIL